MNSVVPNPMMAGIPGTPLMNNVNPMMGFRGGAPMMGGRGGYPMGGMRGGMPFMGNQMGRGMMPGMGGAGFGGAPGGHFNPNFMGGGMGGQSNIPDGPKGKRTRLDG